MPSESLQDWTHFRTEIFIMNNMNLIEQISELPLELQAKILNSLNLHELFNLAKQNKKIHPAARNAFISNHYRRNIALNEISIDYQPQIQSKGRKGFMDSFENLIHVYGEEMCKNFISVFGPCVQHLIINFGGVTETVYEEVFGSINENCINLNEISINWLEFPLKDTLWKFRTVEKVNFNCCEKNIVKLKWVNTHFPNIQHLNLKCVKNDLNNDVNVSL